MVLFKLEHQIEIKHLEFQEKVFYFNINREAH